jgi:signal transduction histidine kinase
MDGLFQQISNILANPPSSLAFNLVLLFCTTTTLQIILLQLRQTLYVYKTRLLTGVLLLLISQVIFFIVAVISWQVPAASHLLMPALDRTFNLFNLILIAWLWTYAGPHRMADISVVILCALVLVFGIFTYLFWANQQSSQAFNISQLDQIWNIISIITTLCLGAALWIEKPQFRIIGLYILFIHLVAFIIHYTSGIVTSDLAASVRLGQLLTYPCLPLLAQRMISKPVESDNTLPLISQVDETFETLPPVQYVQDFHEIVSLKNQLDISNRALAEANTIIDHLKTDNQKLSTAPVKETPPPPIIQSSPDTESFQEFAKVIAPVVSNIRVNAGLVKAEGIGVLGGLQRNFLNEAIELTDRVSIVIGSMASHPQDSTSIAKNFKQTELVTGIDSAVAGVNNAIRSKSLTLRLDLPENPVQLSISQNILEQILVNLLQNAIQVTPAEETISLKVEKIIDDKGTSHLVMQMTDSGGGVTLKNSDKIFGSKPTGSEPRYRGIGSLNNLHLAKTMAEAYGGKIWLESKSKQTTFFVQIPL